MADPSSAKLSPAERYRAATKRSHSPGLSTYRESLAFDLDPFQIASCESVEAGRGVLVAAPTGAGKTAVAEFAIFLALQTRTAKVFYTTPMKALSNQKYTELVEEYGASQIGLLTGDTSINPHARVVIMTTEVLRNMLYAHSELLEDLAYVVMDEVHYLADRFRGAVWEEVIIHLPDSVQLISLSATVSNAEEFGEWLHTVRGDTDIIVSEERPVPLYQHMLVGERMVPLFRSDTLGVTPKVNPEIVQLVHTLQRNQGTRQHYGRGARRGRGRGYDQSTTPRVSSAKVIGMLEREDLLPAIFFVFSRVGCNKSVQAALDRGVDLTSPEEKAAILDLVEEKCERLDEEDLGVLGYHAWVDGLLRGVAAHHAGLLPVFKEVVEEAFRRKLLRVVFATETLALGINMPARTVVLEKLEKFDGESKKPITAGEYTQLTGRAGRRRIDTQGHSVITWRPGMNPEQVAQLASKRSYPLRSSFRPTYNMAVNLIAQFGHEPTRTILESSFAQFQADRHVVEMAKNVRRNEESLAGYEEAIQCDRGHFPDYATLRRALSDREKALRRTSDDSERSEIDALRVELKKHPCHHCPDRESHARWAERWWRLQRETDKMRRQIDLRTGAISVVFDRVVAVLEELDYLRPGEDDYTLSVHGERLRRIYGERDLLTAEALRRQLWTELDPASLAAMVSVLVHEGRADEMPPKPSELPPGPFRGALSHTEELWERLDHLERRHQLTGPDPLSAHRAAAMWEWASGADLAAVIGEDDVAVGDFVRLCKQVVDVLDHIEQVDTGPVGKRAMEAKAQVFRGIVALSSLV
ncbi:DEAD/DEAH box helicase [Pontimonas sp.]|uniref:DEAD/DEAH box helicase n=1 Tax=Pontimonas sp. TaxID=2304492 RepID=UPI00286FB9DA|nr:DEAD/DEAH box helicase [Pontimonas sp.]MDR9396658.1 DEAD/DEAH box helicase [Pontimonas sp.]MDR9433921.1 DEAD/DEAH box helicase [Pontimonas sp.]